MAVQEQRLVEALPFVCSGDGAYYRCGVSMVSRGISVFGRGRYSHVGTFLWLEDVLCIHEFREHYGCRLLLASREVNRYPGQIDFYRTAGSDQQRRRIFARAMSKLGKPYDWTGVVRAARYHVPFLRWTVRIDDDDSAVFGDEDPEHCSSCRADLWAEAGRDLVPNLANRITEPNDLARSALEEYQCTLVP